ncbi:transcription antitermination factor NusB [Acidipila sp. EB88]|uniref:transcription antitermination factor NusB n=1 Tax=Acidipila sp. EB88 TaxID=2305226 RepID=UPI0013153F6D|nr:transcription antitermination factor NusB [Acidipila sp. EB88]
MPEQSPLSSSAPGPAKPSLIAPARIAAAHVLLAVERGTAHSDDQLRSPRVEALSRQDRDLATELVRGVLRWQLVLDREIAARLRYPESDMHFGVIIALRLGVYQLLFLDRIPPHAAINESVELAKQADGTQMASLTNAVLRRIQREQLTLRSLRTDPAAAYPRWLVSRWTQRFGPSAAQAVCAFGQQPPPASIRMLQAGAAGTPVQSEAVLPTPADLSLISDATPEPGHALPAETESDTSSERAESPAASLLPAGTEPSSHTSTEPGAFLTMVRHVLRGDPAAIAGTRIQDEASQLVGELAALQGGSNILDACAAPGGKTAILAERNADATITAMDVSAPRLRIMQRRLPWNADGREQVRFVAGDASMVVPDKNFDTILCDVPCSGTGTLARNPEIRHRLDEEALGRQAERQRSILSAALRALRPGGRLVYSTCSLEAEENEQVVAAVLASVPGAEVLPISAALDELLQLGRLHEAGHARLLETALSGNYLRTIPGVHPCDGFFAALLTIA